MNLTNYVNELCRNYSQHRKSSEYYRNLEQQLSLLVQNSYESNSSPETNLNEDVRFSIPFHSMGNINTKHLFGLDEVIILAFYVSNQNKYKNVLDLGANIGLHSIALAKLGFDVTCFEADPDTYKVLTKNIKDNGVNVNAINAAASSFNGQAEFTRVCGNMTGSHLSGAKPNPYGKLEKFQVNVVNIGELAEQYDLIKIDIEGQEADVLAAIPPKIANKIDFMMEINGEANAKRIFEYTQQSELNIFLQNRGWGKVDCLADLPLSHRDGCVFLSRRSNMPWKNNSDS